MVGRERHLAHIAVPFLYQHIWATCGDSRPRSPTLVTPVSNLGVPGPMAFRPQSPIFGATCDAIRPKVAIPCPRSPTKVRTCDEKYIGPATKAHGLWA